VQGRLLPGGDSGAEGWGSADQFAAVLETAALNEAQLAEYCRKRGLYPEQVKGWRVACEQPMPGTRSRVGGEGGPPRGPAAAARGHLGVRGAPGGTWGSGLPLHISCNRDSLRFA
jgi:hypothetical protein